MLVDNTKRTWMALIWLPQDRIGLSTIWFMKRIGEMESRVVSLHLANHFDKDPSLSMWLDNTKPTWVGLVWLLEATKSGQQSGSLSVLEERSPEWIPHGASWRPLAHHVDEGPQLGNTKASRLALVWLLKSVSGGQQSDLLSMLEEMSLEWIPCGALQQPLVHRIDENLDDTKLAWMGLKW
jgi:hypothetical protein